MTDSSDYSDTARAKLFLENLKKSGILASDKLNAELTKLKKPIAAKEISDQRIVDHFVDSGLVTRWQAEKLIRGRYKGFFLAKYTLLDHLGTGGMSTVYLAEHNLTGQKRAIKVLPRKKLSERSYLNRFYREGRSVAALNHPNIVRIYDIASENGTHFMVMEYVQGSDLFDIVNDSGPVDFELARHCIVQSAQGLAHAHENNLVHRDIKPANLLLTKQNQIKVLDLGLALLKCDDDEFSLSKQYNERMMGTVDFLAPEQAVNSHTVDQRADIYSLGCTLYYLLTGFPPFNKGTLAQRIARHQMEEPPAITTFRADCPPQLEAVCQKMMRKCPDDRFQDCHELIAACGEGLLDEITQCISKPTATDITTRNQSAIRARQFKSHTTPTRKKHYSTAVLLGLGVLSVAVLILALSVIKKSNTPTAIVTSAELKSTVALKNERPQTVDADQSEARSQTATPISEHRRLVDLRPASKTSKSTFQINFEAPNQIRKSNNKWELMSDNVVFGRLITGHKCKIIVPPENISSDNGNRCLLLRGDSDDVEFRPLDENARIDTVSFLAQRQNDGSDFQFLIQAKPTHSGPERWQTIVDSTKDVNNNHFQLVVIPAESFNAIASRKFRFKVVGADNDGVYIDDLTIELK